MRHAHRRAGGWKALFASRHATLREADPWHKPSPFEVQASGERRQHPWSQTCVTACRLRGCMGGRSLGCSRDCMRVAGLAHACVARFALTSNRPLLPLTAVPPSLQWT